MWKPVFLLFSLLTLKYSTSVDSAAVCDGSEQSGTFLEVAQKSILTAKELNPDCISKHDDTSTSISSSDEFFVCLDLAVNMISEAVKNYTSIPEPLIKKYMDCSEIWQDRHNVSGVYKIWPKSAKKSLDVFCDMTTAGGGWTVIQRRGKFSKQQDFYLDWEDYKVGFGNISEEFWIGNENIFALTNQGQYTVRFDLGDTDGSRVYALYQSFRIEDEKNNYTLRISGYSGNAGESMIYSNNSQFSTKDKPNVYGCANIYKAGFWYLRCAYANVNGLFLPGSRDNYQSFHWYDWRKSNGLSFSEIKIRRK